MDAVVRIRMIPDRQRPNERSYKEQYDWCNVRRNFRLKNTHE